MTILMTGLCEKGADQIWKQCNDALYAQGVTWLEEAAYAGDAEAWFFLGHCYSWGDGAVGFNEKKAYECYLRGASAAKMAAESLGQIRDMVSDQELWKDITESYEKHQELDAKIKKTLSAMEEEGKEPGKMASAWSWMSTEMRMLAKGGDKEAASIVTDGCNMGIKTICGYKNQYSGASKAVMEIADELTGMEENLRDHMKKFL